MARYEATLPWGTTIHVNSELPYPVPSTAEYGCMCAMSVLLWHPHSTGSSCTHILRTMILPQGCAKRPPATQTLPAVSISLQRMNFRFRKPQVSWQKWEEAPHTHQLSSHPPQLGSWHLPEIGEGRSPPSTKPRSPISPQLGCQPLAQDRELGKGWWVGSGSQGLAKTSR